MALLVLGQVLRGGEPFPALLTAVGHALAVGRLMSLKCEGCGEKFVAHVTPVGVLTLGLVSPRMLLVL